MGPRRMIRPALGLLGCLVVASCGSSTARGGGPPTADGSAQAYSVAASGGGGAGYGIPAGQLAARVPGCGRHPVTARQAARLGFPRSDRLYPPSASGAECRLQGRSALLVSYAGDRAESAAASVAYRGAAYFAVGPGWLAVPLDLSEPVGQQSVVQDVALALNGRVLRGAHAP